MGNPAICPPGKKGKRQKGMALGFANHLINVKYPEIGPDCLATSTPFDEAKVLRENLPIVLNSLPKIDPKNVSIYMKNDTKCPDPKKQRAKANPGKPTFCFSTC